MNRIITIVLLLNLFSSFAFASDWKISQTSDTTVNEFSIGRIYPNPFSPCYCPSFTIPDSCNIQIAMLNKENDTVDFLEPKLYGPGIYQATLNRISDSLKSGMYYFEFKATSISEMASIYYAKYRFLILK